MNFLHRYTNVAALMGGFSPLSLSPAFWLKDTGYYEERTGAAATTVSSDDADPVGSWLDQSGNARHFVAAADAARGALKLNIINGRSVVRFDGLASLLSCATLTEAQVPTGADVTYFAVVRFAALVRNDEFMYLGNDTMYAPNFHNVVMGKENAADKVLFNNYDGSEHRAITDAAVAINTPYILVGARQSNVNKIWLNGTLQATAPASGTPDVNAAAIFNIGGRPGALASVDLAELGAVARALTAGELAGLLDYLNAKWAAY